MAKLKYPWKSTTLGNSFSVKMVTPQYARGVAWQRKRYGEFWSVRYDRQTKIATYTRISEKSWGKYNWAMQPGSEQEFKFSSRLDAMKAMYRCMAQVRFQNRRAGPQARNWLVAPTADGLGFTLRRRMV